MVVGVVSLPCGLNISVEPKAVGDNRELLGKAGGLRSNRLDLNKIGALAGGSVQSLQITLAGISLSQPSYALNWAHGDYIRAWNDWGSLLQSSIGNTSGAQSLIEYQQDMLFSLRIMGDPDSVAQNLCDAGRVN